jgi:GTP cyclohydrolase II
MNSPPTATNGIQLEQVAEAAFPCVYGDFRILGFRGRLNGDASEIVVLKTGEILAEGDAPLVRIHSQCLTGEVFHSLRCDCGEQLEMALRQIGQEGRGLLIYDPQEGRGIGLLNKLRAYQLQDEGADTVEANEQLGFAADLRNYELAAAVLHALGVTRVRLLSNNPAKVAGLEQAGIEVTERVSCEVPRSERTAGYLRTKKDKMGHILEGL